MNPAIAVAHAGLTYLLDPSLEAGLLLPTGTVVIGGTFELKNPASPPDRDVLVPANPLHQIPLRSRP
jgi:hypothetical protein